MNMKTMKNILKALFAFAAFVMVGCTADQTYTPGGDLSGEQIYIDNTMSVFYVQTAEEKQAEAEELKKLSHGLQKDEVYTDDTFVDLKVVRKSSKLAQFDFEVMLTMLAEDVELFTLPAGATQTGADQAAKTVVYTVPCSFDADAAETVLRLGFDISKLATNTEYEFVAELVDLENSSNYGADNHEFAIMHSVPVELPFEDVGTVSLEETFYRDFFGVPSGIYSDCVIQIHKDDKAAIDAAKVAGTTPTFAAGYVRFYIPRFMYQVAAASVAAGDGAYAEEDLEYFAQGCGIMVCMTPKYELVESDLAATYPHPLHPDKAPSGYPRSPAVFVDTVDGNVYSYNFQFGRVYAGTVPCYESTYGELEIVLFDPSLGYSSPSTRSMNTYTLNTSYFAAAKGNLWSTPFIFTWDKNTLEADWANYFKIDYNNDINYSALGVGIFTSEYQDNFATKYLYKGVEEVSGNTVYYVDDPYGTATDATGYLGLALTWNGTTAAVADMQPLNIQWNGRELYASQSQKVKSAIQFNESGNITKITFGVAIVNEEGAVLGDYTETFDIEAPEVGLEAFLGDFTQVAYELYGPYDDSSQAAMVQSIKQAFSPLSSTVTIEQATDEAGNPIANKVKIYGMVPTDYDLSTKAGGYLEGTYDPTSNSIDIPAQFFHDMEWDGKALVGAEMAIFPYFQPGMTNYNVYNTSKGYYWFSELAQESKSVALHYANGMLQMAPSTNDPVAADGYSVILGYYDASYDEFVVDVDNMTFFTTISFPSFGVYAPTFVPASGDGGGVMPLSKKFVKKSNGIETFKARKVRGEKVEIANKLAQK